MKKKKNKRKPKSNVDQETCNKEEAIRGPTFCSLRCSSGKLSLSWPVFYRNPVQFSLCIVATSCFESVTLLLLFYFNVTSYRPIWFFDTRGPSTISRSTTLPTRNLWLNRKIREYIVLLCSFSFSGYWLEPFWWAQLFCVCAILIVISSCRNFETKVKWNPPYKFIDTVA